MAIGKADGKGEVVDKGLAEDLIEQISDVEKNPMEASESHVIDLLVRCRELLQKLIGKDRDK